MDGSWGVEVNFCCFYVSLSDSDLRVVSFVFVCSFLIYLFLSFYKMTNNVVYSYIWNGTFYIYICNCTIPHSTPRIQIRSVWKQTAAVLECYFRFRFWLYYPQWHTIFLSLINFIKWGPWRRSYDVYRLSMVSATASQTISDLEFPDLINLRSNSVRRQCSW